MKSLRKERVREFGKGKSLQKINERKLPLDVVFDVRNDGNEKC